MSLPNLKVEFPSSINHTVGEGDAPSEDILPNSTLENDTERSEKEDSLNGSPLEACETPGLAGDVIGAGDSSVEKLAVENIHTDSPEELPSAIPILPTWQWSKLLNCFACCGNSSGNREQESQVKDIVFVSQVPSMKTLIAQQECNEGQYLKTLSTKIELVKPQENLNVSLSDLGKLLTPRVGRRNIFFVVTGDEFYYNAKKWKEAESEDFFQTLRKQDNFFPSKASIVLSEGTECVNIVQCKDLSTTICILELNNCKLGFMQLAEILLRCKHLTQVTVSMSNDEYKFYRYHEKFLVGTPDDDVVLARYRESIDQMVKDLQETLQHNQPMTKVLNRVKLHFPYLKACTVACALFNAVYGDSLQLEELEISCSQQKMILTLKQMNAANANEVIVRESMTLDCDEILFKSRITLRKLTLSCGDQFPLDWLKHIPDEELSYTIGLKYQLTCGLLSSLVHPDKENLNSVFPNLEELSLILPLLRLVPAWAENDKAKEEQRRLFRSLMMGVYAFAAGHLYRLQRLVLEGVRTEKIMVPWMKESLCAGHLCSTSLGVTYYSSELKQQLHDYYDEISSLGIILDKDTFDGNLNTLINPNQDKKNMLFPSIFRIHIVNKLDTLRCFSIPAIVEKFPRISTLVIEDYTYVKAIEKPTSVDKVGLGDNRQIFLSRAKIGNVDLKKIVQKLGGTLRILHLDCDLSEVTDSGITGYTRKQNWCSVKNQKDVFSFALVPGLRYLYLKGFGDHVTDISAKLCFSETLQFKNLRELHLFAPKITGVGKSMIQDRFSSHCDFILELE